MKNRTIKDLVILVIIAFPISCFAEGIRESQLLGKWQGPRLTTQFLPDHTFNQGFYVKGMTWSFAKGILTMNYPEVGDNLPSLYYPQPGTMSFSVVEASEKRLVLNRTDGNIFIHYKLSDESKAAREAAAAQANADTVSANKMDQTATFNPLATRGAEKFAIKNLRVGDGQRAIEQFLSSNNLKQLGGHVPDYVEGEESTQRIHYVKGRSYSNGLTGLKQLEAELEFTPPYPNGSTVESVVYAISYTTHFGEGVSWKEVAADLKKRYGKPTSEWEGDYSFEKGNLKWEIYTKSYTPDFIAEAKISVPKDAGEVGSLTISALDNTLRNEAEKKARKHATDVDAARGKDKTKPSY